MSSQPSQVKLATYHKHAPSHIHSYNFHLEIFDDIRVGKFGHILLWFKKNTLE